MSNTIALGDLGDNNLIFLQGLENTPLVFTPTPTASITPTAQVTPSATFTPTPTPTITPSATITPSPTITPTISPSYVPLGTYSASYEIKPGDSIWYVHNTSISVEQGVCNQVKIKIYYSWATGIKTLQTDVFYLIQLNSIPLPIWVNTSQIFSNSIDAFNYLTTLYSTNGFVTPTPSVSPTLNIQIFSYQASAPSGILGIDYTNGEYFDGFYGDYGVSNEGIDLYVGNWYE